jgi:translation initiation factor IF-2
VLGHIDHGKSSILQAIKDLKILERESGGITQHIGAYEIEKDGKKITFLDTPGHEAFSQMRARGAKVADLAVLVVAADEGVKTQTKEAISHIKKANLPFLVAINKIDKSTANIEKVERELALEGVLVEAKGGKVPSVLVSAHTKKGIEDLLDLILLMAEMEDLKTNLDKEAQGVIIEAYLDKLRGPSATLILNQGTLTVGQIVGTLSTYGKIRGLENFQGKAIERAFPSSPTIVFGFEEVPGIGEEIKVFPDLDSARLFAQRTEKKIFTSSFLSVKEGQKVLNLIIKSDVLGTLQALEEIVANISNEDLALRVLRAEIGQVNENDVKLAKSAKAIIFAFRVKISPVAQLLAEKEGVKIKYFEVIYDLVEEIQKLIEKIKEPELTRIYLGKVKILAVFKTDKSRQIVGGKVIEGEIKKGVKLEIWRGEDLVGEGSLVNLQKNKEDVSLVSKGQECGILYEGEGKIEEGDILKAYIQEKRK